MPAYIGRLVAIQELLNSPLQERVQMGYQLLFDLWREHQNDADFYNYFKPITAKNQSIVQDFEIRLQKLSQANVDKREVVLLRNNLKMFASEISTVSESERFPSSSMQRQQPDTKIEVDSLFNRIVSIATLLIGLSGLLGGISMGFEWGLGVIIAFILTVVALLLLLVYYAFRKR